ncbi:hypothetical protein PENTCL1PPCAC_27522, partial [Pristionchus entomophagus]
RVEGQLAKIIALLESTPPTVPSPSIPSTLASIQPTLELSRQVYEASTRAFLDRSEYAEKETRAVVIGSLESKNDGLAMDQKLVGDLVDYCGSGDVKKAWSEGRVEFKRHPSDRPPGSRPLKISFKDQKTRDSFLSDLTPTQLQMEREARKDAVKKNLDAGQLMFGVRDYSLISYRTPRPLPPHYGTPRASRSLYIAADISSAAISLSTPLSSISSFSRNPSCNFHPPRNLPNLSVFYANCRSIRSKSAHLSFLISSFAYPIVALCETWLDSCDSDSLLIGDFPDYFVFRNDQCISIDLHLIFSPSLPFRRIRIINVYRSPSAPALSLSSFVNYLSLLVSDDFPCIILGDFNLPHVDWLTLCSPSQNVLLDFVSDYRFTQCVHFPTRLTNYLDLVFCNSNIIHNVSSAPPLSDHLSITFELSIPSPPPRRHIPSRIYRLADWQSINDFIFNHDWTLALRDLCANDAYVYFTNVITNLLDTFIPLSRPSEFSRYPRKVRILYGKFKSLSRIAPNSVACHTMSKRFKSALNSFHCYLEDRIVTTSNSSAFYKFCSGKLKAPKSTPSAIIDSNGTTLLTNDEKCVSFSEFFSSVFSFPQYSPLPLPTPSLTFDLPYVSEIDILKFTINNVVLNEPTVKDKNLEKVIVKDLGVHFSPSLSFSYHISKVVSKSRSIMNLMFKSFHSTSPSLYCKAFTTFILPNLEYSSVIWNPTHSIELTKDIEKVQRDFTRRLYSRCTLPHVSYLERLRALKLTTLEQRRFVSDIVFLHSVLHKRYLLEVSSLLVHAPLVRSIRNSHPLRIALPFFPHNSHSTLASRSISTWNSLLPESVALSHDAFRTFISSQPPSFSPT